MFNNIGGKIKKLAIVLTVIGIILSVVTGFSPFTLTVKDSNSEPDLLGGLLTVGIGVLSSWLGSFLLYGFGELIEKSAITAENTEHLCQLVQSGRGLAVQQRRCPTCGNVSTDTICARCGAPMGVEQPSAGWTCPICGTLNHNHQNCRKCEQKKP